MKRIVINPVTNPSLKQIETLLNNEAQKKKLSVFVEIEGNGIAIYDKKRMSIVSIYEKGTMTDRQFITWLRKRLRDESARLKQGYQLDEYTEAYHRRYKNNPHGYESQAQRGKLHAMLERGEIDAATVRKFDRESKGRKLPKYVNPYYVLSDRKEAERRIRKLTRQISQAQKRIDQLEKHGEEYISSSDRRELSSLYQEIELATKNIEHLYNAVNHHGTKLFENPKHANPTYYVYFIHKPTNVTFEADHFIADTAKDALEQARHEIPILVTERYPHIKASDVRVSLKFSGKEASQYQYEQLHKNPKKQQTLRERCEEMIHGKQSDEPTFSYYRDVENPTEAEKEKELKALDNKIKRLRRDAKRPHLTLKEKLSLQDKIMRFERERFEKRMRFYE